MSEMYFDINYEFDRDEVHSRIARQVACRRPDYICVADGVILDNVHRMDRYRQVVNGGMFSICDSSYVPLYIKMIYGERKRQYTGCEILRDVVSSRRYRMAFMGSRTAVLEGLRNYLATLNPDVADMLFYELPFRDVEDFDYEAIARMLSEDGADIIWLALGAPKQEYFMHHLKPYLDHGVMIAVGAAFKFYSGVAVRRAPDWMLSHHLEFVYRLYTEPGKQLRRCRRILGTLPIVLHSEWKKKRRQEKESHTR